MGRGRGREAKLRCVVHLRVQETEQSVSPFFLFFFSMSLPRLMRNDGAMRRPIIQAARLILLAARDGSWRKEIDAGRSLCFDDSKDGLQQVTF